MSIKLDISESFLVGNEKRSQCLSSDAQALFRYCMILVGTIGKAKSLAEYVLGNLINNPSYWVRPAGERHELARREARATLGGNPSLSFPRATRDLLIVLDGLRLDDLDPVSRLIVFMLWDDLSAEQIRDELTGRGIHFVGGADEVANRIDELKTICVFAAKGETGTEVFDETAE